MNSQIRDFGRTLATRRVFLAALTPGLSMATSARAQTGVAPIRFGSTLSLTGPLAQTGAIHKIAGEVFLAKLNSAGGLLGRPVEWDLLDDQSKPELARTLYERLITVDKVDLLLGPYGTGAILAVLPVAERYGKTIASSTFGIPKLSHYARHFPIWPMGLNPDKTYISLVLDALGAAGAMPKTIAVVTSKFPSVQFIAAGARDVAKERGINVPLYLEFEFGARDFGAIAARVREANPDLLFAGTLGLEGNSLLEALDKLNYKPRNHFYVYPSPGPLAASALGAGALATAIFEDQPPMNVPASAHDFTQAFHEAAIKAKLSYPDADTQAAISYAAWQVLAAGVQATNGLSDADIATWIKGHTVDTVIGSLHFDGPSNYGDDLTKIKQVQDGKWVIVWPKEYVAPGKSIVAVSSAS